MIIYNSDSCVWEEVWRKSWILKRLPTANGQKRSKQICIGCYYNIYLPNLCYLLTYIGPNVLLSSRILVWLNYYWEVTCHWIIAFESSSVTWLEIRYVRKWKWNFRELNGWWKKHYSRQGVKARTLGKQNERNFCYDWLALTSIFGLCFVSVCLIK